MFVLHKKLRQVAMAKKFDVSKILTDPEQCELQARALLFYNRENVRDQIAARTQTRINSLTTHTDFRNCVDHSAATVPAPIRPATVPKKNKTKCRLHRLEYDK